ncbi:hypothetical protein HDU87_004423 [Geranomyces variabilis]|uniref:Uncharacterized protein n=1 Tax=Geranomyces variabilis TaxID=109894 RepID=A0AAD5TI78_9FUNG|nr:hypothetical protein HDU87_004423 [Geranomyces variabilis]
MSQQPSPPAFFAWCRCRFPASVNNPTPDTLTLPNVAVPPYEGTGAYKEWLCLVTEFNHQLQEATLFLGSSAPYLEHRFVPVDPCAPRPGQLAALQTVPAAFFREPGGHLNISHPIRATVVFTEYPQDVQDKMPPADLWQTSATLTAESRTRFLEAVSAYSRRRVSAASAAATASQAPPPPPPPAAASSSGAAAEGAAAPSAAAPPMPWASVVSRPAFDNSSNVSNNQARQATLPGRSGRRFLPSPEELYARYAVPADSEALHWEGGKLVGGVDWPDDSSDYEAVAGRAPLCIDTSPPAHARPVLELRSCGLDGAAFGSD